MRRGEEEEQRKEGEKNLYNHFQRLFPPCFSLPNFWKPHFFICAFILLFFLNVSKRFKLASYGLQERPIA